MLATLARVIRGCCERHSRLRAAAAADCSNPLAATDVTSNISLCHYALWALQKQKLPAPFVMAQVRVFRWRSDKKYVRFDSRCFLRLQHVALLTSMKLTLECNFDSQKLYCQLATTLKTVVEQLSLAVGGSPALNLFLFAISPLVHVLLRLLTYNSPSTLFRLPRRCRFTRTRQCTPQPWPRCGSAVCARFYPLHSFPPSRTPLPMARCPR